MKTLFLPRVAIVTTVASILVACSASNDSSSESNAQSLQTVTHSEDLATVTHAELTSVIPSQLAIMLSMAWFGIPKTGDPDGPGTDPGWGNWEIGTKCSAHGDPAACVDGQRNIASRYRPLAGIYSSTGRDDESLARIRLALSTVRRPCANDVGARIDSFAIQLDGTKFTSLHDKSPSASEESPYQALLQTFNEANKAGLKNAVLPADDATWYFGNGQGPGKLTCSTKDESQCYDALQGDVIDMLTLSLNNESALKFDGKPVLYFYVSDQLSPAQWSSLFAKARATVINGTTHDFFALASTQGGHGSEYFAAFDAVSPWIDLSAWKSTSGATVREHATAYAKAQHDELYAAVPKGKVVLGGVGPGFDDFTNGWNTCETRQIPEKTASVAPRDPGVLDGEIDYLQSKGTKWMVLQTWDDWTEGSFMEPSVSEGTTKLVQLQTRLGELFGEPAVSPSALENRWTSYGQPRSCTGAKPSPNIDLCGAVTTPLPPSCSPPQILEPTNGESVGPSIHLRTSAASCIASVIPYIDGVRPSVTYSGTALDVWVPVTLGGHELNVNGWDAEGNVYTSTKIPFTRTY